MVFQEWEQAVLALVIPLKAVPLLLTKVLYTKWGCHMCSNSLRMILNLHTSAQAQDVISQWDKYLVLTLRNLALEVTNTAFSLCQLTWFSQHRGKGTCRKIVSSIPFLSADIVMCKFRRVDKPLTIKNAKPHTNTFYLTDKGLRWCTG